MSNSDGFHEELVGFLRDNHDMRKTARNSLKQSLWAGGGAFAGSMLLGPVGGLVGGVAGSAAGYFMSDPYDGAVLAVLKLEEERRKVLMTEVRAVLMGAGATAQQLQSSDGFREAIFQFAEQDAVRNGVW
eukprot:CAMPEP_0195519366 /NCGR_PEP_ID=MMETSP0794_2-20130614/14606_1 /TAXON_ID=515487 /ORGANISM="Stephanopyxis turris, Strain CCMP 815" /LENGTH=129 /DNA_ID=CAMNT_0040648505 /DNA_START=133 /DNA_END=519 /DNA_ORIENTATION=-